MPRSYRLVPAALLGAALVAGCSGSPATTQGASPAPAGTTATGSTSPAATAGPSDTAGPALLALAPAELLRRARANALRSAPVHVVGAAGSGAGKVAFDLSLQSATRGKGSLTLGGARIEGIRDGATVYVKTDGQLPGQAPVGKEIVKLLKGKWVKGSATDSRLGQFARMFTTEGALTQFLPKAGASLVKKPLTTVAGRPALPLESPADRTTVFLAVDRAEPLPLRLTGSDAAGTGVLDFLEWGREVTVALPPAADVIDSSTLPGR